MKNIQHELVDAVVNKALSAFNVPGAAVGIVVDGNIVMAKGYGIRNCEQELSVTDKTLFAIGSCTKAFTTFLLGQLADEGKITWDDAVIKHIPEFRLMDQHATHKLTIRDLVAHRSGMPRHDMVWYNAEVSRAELIARLEFLEPVCDIREKFQYNNLMYATAGMVIERVTGVSWEDAIKNCIFMPLGMHNSNISVVDSQMGSDFSVPYEEKNDAVVAMPFRNLCNIAPAGAINSSIADMVKWLQLQLMSGMVGDKTIIRKETLQEMHTAHIATGPFPTDTIYNSGYGLGWGIGSYKGHYFVQHGGGIDGFISQVSLLPQNGIGVVILTNSSSGGGYVSSCVINTIFDVLLGADEVDWISKTNEIYTQVKISKKTVEENKQEDVQESKSLIRPLIDYVGNYEHPGYGFVQIVLENDQLIAVHNNTKMQLKHKCYDIFVGTVAVVVNYKVNISFISDTSGQINEIHIPFELLLKPIVFMRKNEQVDVELLKKCVGIFEGLSDTKIEIQIRGSMLVMLLANQAAHELIPEKNLTFTIKGLPGFSVQFVSDDIGLMVELKLIQPNGVFSFKLKNK